MWTDYLMKLLQKAGNDVELEGMFQRFYGTSQGPSGWGALRLRNIYPETKTYRLRSLSNHYLYTLSAYISHVT